jgi:hypothetical protein
MKRIILLVFIALLISCKEKEKQELNESKVVLDTTDIEVQVLKQTTNVELENYKFENEIFDNWLKLGLAESEVIKNLGVAEKDTTYFNEVNGYNGKDIFYLKKGLKIILNDSENKYAVEQIEIGSKSNLKTKFDIGIGSNYEDVMKVYSKYINKDETTKENIVIGDMYFGLHFFFKNKKVNEIILGSLAE